MAVDFLLLQRYPAVGVSRFRHYDWRAPAFTFGYGQKISFVRGQLPPDDTFDLCRRPTGGGIVDHRDDWTYALVIARGHPLEELRATLSYRAVHEALAETLQAQSVPAILKPAIDPDADTAAGVCFQRAELYDVVNESTGEKIAGAAQKRNKHGLLFQGSIARSAGRTPDGSPVDWERFETEFALSLARVLGTPAESVPWPEFNEDEVSGLTEHYSSPEWIAYR